MTRLFRDFDGEPLCAQGSVVCIGAFDGLHLGHRALLGHARERAGVLGLPLVALSFEPLPREFFAGATQPPRLPPPRLLLPRMKFEGLRELGVDLVGLLHFNATLVAMPAAEFVHRMLVERLSAREVWVGPEFRFGHGREGDFELLRRLGTEQGFGAHAIAPLLLDGERVSSSAIRRQLAAGDLDGAARALGRPYAIAGTVVHGRQLGRTLGYPTANLRLQGKLPALGGIYASRVHGVGATARPSVSSLGTRPTVRGPGSIKAEPLLEAHLFDFDGDLYGQRIEVEFIARLRDEETFDGLDALVAQMHRDAAQARAILCADFDNATMRHMGAPPTSHA